MPGVKDLLVRMSLDTSTYKTQIADAKREMQALKGEYKALESSDSIGKGAEKLLEKLREQKKAAEAMIEAYRKGIVEIEDKLTAAQAAGKKTGDLESQLQKLRQGLSDAETQANNLQNKINNLRIDKFIDHARTVAQAIQDIQLGLGDFLNAAGEAADHADEVNVSREQAFIDATKNVRDEHQTQEDLDALNAGLREMTTRIPLAYEELAALMGVAATLGVLYEDLLGFTEVMAKLAAATNVSGESGAQQMAQLLNITDKGYANVDRAGAAVTALGNNSATTEQQILEMSQRSATALRQVGMNVDDILALSAALSSVGINAEAGGSAVSKLGVKMDKAANVGAANIDTVLHAAKAMGLGADSVYEFYARLDNMPQGEGWKSFYAQMGMTEKDARALIDSALAAERFSQAMGMTAEEFSTAWQADSAAAMLQFFQALGSIDEASESGQNMLWVMDQLGITEIRQSNMVRALAGNWELYAHLLEISRAAYAENIALDNEAERKFATNESRRQMNANKAENAAEATGRSVTAMRKPWEDFFADMQQWYASWPGWAQDAVGAVTEIMGVGGDLLNTAGQIAFDVVNLAEAKKLLADTGAGKWVAGKWKTLTTAGEAAAGGGLAVGGALGAAAVGALSLYVYLDLIKDTSKETAEILSNLQISVDEESKQATLRSLQEVRDAANNITPDEEERLRGVSQVVQMGYGTADMYGEALGWEMSQGEKAVEKILTDYGTRIYQEQQALLAATDDASRMAAQARIENLTDEMNQAAAEAQAAADAAVQAVIDGASRQAQVAKQAKMGDAGEMYGFVSHLLGMDKTAGEIAETQVLPYYEALAMARKMYLGYEASGRSARYDPGEEEINAFMEATKALGFDWNKEVRQNRGNYLWGDFATYRDVMTWLYAQMAPGVEKVLSDEAGMTAFLSAVQGGVYSGKGWEDLDPQVQGLLAALDAKNWSGSVENWYTLGQDSVLGLKDGMLGGQSTAEGASSDVAQSVIDAARTTLQSHSPSLVMQGIGGDVAEGLALGIEGGVSRVVSAIQGLGDAAAKEAAVQAARISAALQVIAPLPVYAGSAGGSSVVNGGARIINNTYNLNGGTVQEQRGVRDLARRLNAYQRQQNEAYGG